MPLKRQRESVKRKKLLLPKRLGLSRKSESDKRLLKKRRRLDWNKKRLKD